MYPRRLDFVLTRLIKKNGFQKRPRFRPKDIPNSILAFHQQAIQVGVILLALITHKERWRRLWARSISRNLYRDQAESCAADPMAWAPWRKTALIKGFDKALSSFQSESFWYCRLCTSESAVKYMEIAVVCLRRWKRLIHWSLSLKHKENCDRFAR